VALEEHDTETARRLLDESLELLRTSGHRYRVAKCLELSARLAAAQNRVHRAAHLYGAASVSREAVGAGMFKGEVWFEGELWPDPAPHIARLRSELGESVFDETWARGRAMTLDEALDYALDEEIDDELAPPQSVQRSS